MAMIKGITVVLYDKEEIGKDNFNMPIYKEIPITINNVLIAPSSTDDIVTSTDLVGKKAIYTLAIPKDDTHNWEDKKVHFYGQDWRVFGFSIEGIDENIPLDWNKKVMVERYG